MDPSKIDEPLQMSFSINYENKILKEELLEFFKTKCDMKYCILAEEIGANGKEHFQGFVLTRLYLDKRTFLRKYWSTSYTCKPRSAIFKEVSTQDHLKNIFPYLCKGYQKQRLDEDESIQPKVRIINNPLNWTEEEIRHYNHTYHSGKKETTKTILDEIENNIKVEITHEECQEVYKYLPETFKSKYGFDYWTLNDTLTSKLHRFILAKRLTTYFEEQKKTWSIHQIERYVNYFLCDHETTSYLKYKFLFN